MKGNKGEKRYLISAIIWTVVALLALVLLLFAQGPGFGKISGCVLVALCLAGQWLRYFKSR